MNYSSTHPSQVPGNLTQDVDRDQPIMTVCDDCYNSNGGRYGNVLLSLLPNSNYQSEKKFGMSFEKNQRTCSYDKCPLCANQASWRKKVLKPEDDPDFIKRVQDPYDLCKDRGLVPPPCFIDSSKFNSAVLIFVWLMIAFWISMMVLMTFDDRTYLTIGRQGTGAGFGAYFSGASRNASLFGGNSKNDIFSLICIVVCILNVVMVLNRMMSCGRSNPPPPPAGFSDPGLNVPMGMGAYALNGPQPDEPFRVANAPAPPSALNSTPAPSGLPAGAGPPMLAAPHAVHDGQTNVHLRSDPAGMRNPGAVIRSSQFLTEPDLDTSSNASSFLNYGPNSLRMDSIVQQKGSRLSQCGDDDDDNDNVRRRRPMPLGAKNKLYEQSFGQKVREALRRRPNFPLLRPPTAPVKVREAANKAKSVKEIQPPVLGRGKPVTDQDMDRMGCRVNRHNESYVPTNRSVFLTKTERQDLAGEGGHFLGRLRSTPEEDPNEGSEVSIMERWKEAGRAASRFNSLPC